jgi:hypothetical protein
VGSGKIRAASSPCRDLRRLSLRLMQRRISDLNIFGSPNFVVDREVFWGDDRLDDALAWARFGNLRSPQSGV